jgi:hypothetical protein
MIDAAKPLPQALPVGNKQQQTEHLKRVFEAWPYLFMTISLAGLIYIGLNAIR